MPVGSKTTEDTFIRLLPYSVVRYVSSLLDIDRKWERLVVKIPKQLSQIGDPDAEPRYSSLQIRLFENSGRRCDASPTQAVLDDWGTQNTKVRHLLAVLSEASLYEAADYISVNVLHKEKVPRNQTARPSPQLPSPGWEPDDKPKKGALPMNSNLNMNDTHMKSSEGMKLVGMGTGGYSSLSNHKTDPPYNQLEPDIVYNRTPSYDSEPSVPLKGSNFHGEHKEKEQEAFDSVETLQIRELKETANLSNGPAEKAVYHDKDMKIKTSLEQTLNKKADISKIKVPEKPRVREPCEVDDVSCDTDSPGIRDIYSMIGSQEINYDLLQMITNNFNSERMNYGGRLIGTGGFGEVFLGIFKNGYKVAIKRLKKMEEAAEIEKQFRTELDSLITYRHKNIVRLYGYSIDGPGKCLVYEYLCNGSLEDRLQRTGKTPPLSNAIRVSVLQGTADGIAFLNKQGIIHRDIKSANVLLDENFSPKVGDFATARGGPRGNNTMAMSTQVVIGTSAYLAPEALHFDVSTKLDSYSFGIVILEIVTGLPPLDQDREEKDLKSHVEENEVEDVLDMSGGEWNMDIVEKLLKISSKCTERTKKRRSNVADILDELMSINADF